MLADSRSPDPVTGTPQASSDRGPCWNRVFPGEGRQIGALRQWLASLLPPCPAREDVIYVASELGTNAVLHTASGQGGSFEVEVTWHGPVVRVAVADGGAPAGPRLVDDPLGQSGRGLLIVRSLAVRTGQRGDHRGRLIWADVPWDTAAAGPVVPDSREAAIGAGLASLASRFRGVPAWFGRSTLQWWALAGGELVSAPSAGELGGVLDDLLGTRSAPMPDARGRARADAAGQRFSAAAR
jgi:anti-sigma regulatory factor (Ser/Thr protein kinase)